MSLAGGFQHAANTLLIPNKNAVTGADPATSAVDATGGQMSAPEYCTACTLPVHGMYRRKRSETDQPIDLQPLAKCLDGLQWNENVPPAPSE
jgi:hypothetical protein